MSIQREELERNIQAIKDEMKAAAERAGRDPQEITLIAASKTQSSQTIRDAIAAGITVCGENRVQEMLPHLEDKAYEGAQIHFIGHLQTNKVRQVVGEVSLIQSVSSPRLLDEINKQAERCGICQNVLLEVNIGREENKGGVMPEGLLLLAQYAVQLTNVRLRGLMCIPPATAPEVELRAYFAQMRQLFVDMKDKIRDNKSDIDCLSMGMSGDFALAIEEGATMVRVGTAIFGARPPIQKM